jgi:hypothetical protein
MLSSIPRRRFAVQTILRPLVFTPLKIVNHVRMKSIVVPVAQPAERRTVDAVVEGSNPFGHPPKQRPEMGVIDSQP